MFRRQRHFLLNNFIHADFKVCDRSYLIHHVNNCQLPRQYWMCPWEPKIHQFKVGCIEVRFLKDAIGCHNAFKYSVIG